MDCCSSLYNMTPADSLIYLKLHWCSQTELLWTTTHTDRLKHTVTAYNTAMRRCMHKTIHAAAALNSFSSTVQRLIPPDDPLLGSGFFFFLRFPPLPLFEETSLDIQVFYSICGSDHPSSRSITLPAAFINDLVSQPALECSRLSRMIDH